MKIIILMTEVLFVVIAVFLMATTAFGCPMEPVKALPAHLVPKYCSCYAKNILEPYNGMRGHERSQLVCAGQAWDTAHKESKRRST